MYPVVEILGRSNPTYGLMAAAGFVCGLLFVIFVSRRARLDSEAGVYVYTFGLIGCGVGAKLLYLLVSAGQIARDIEEYGWLKTVIAYIQGGMVFYGGLLGAIAAAVITARYLKMNIKDYYPALVPGIAIMAGFGRIGCFLTGCCYGAHTDSPLHIIYPEGALAPAGTPLVPVQLYEALFEFLMVPVLLLIIKLKPALSAKLLAIYCAAYAVFRFVLEFWRADDVRGIWGPLSTSQWISLLLIAFIAVKEVLNTRRKAGNTAS